MNIPVQLIKYSLENKYNPTIRVYLFLKWETSGHFLLTPELIQTALDKLSIKSKKTLIKHIDLLLEWKWITVNSKRNSYRIISYKQLAKKLNFRAHTGAIFYPVDFTKLYDFMYGALITYMVKNRQRLKRQSQSKKAGCSMNCQESLSDYPNLPCRYLAKSIGVSQSTASTYKQKAAKHNYISTEKMFEPIYDIPADSNDYWYHYGERPPNIVIKNGIYQIQLPDKISPNIHLRSKKEIKSVIKSNGKNPKR